MVMLGCYGILKWREWARAAASVPVLLKAAEEASLD
jgi:hypothetical protein